MIHIVINYCNKLFLKPVKYNIIMSYFGCCSSGPLFSQDVSINSIDLSICTVGIKWTRCCSIQSFCFWLPNSASLICNRFLLFCSLFVIIICAKIEFFLHVCMQYGNAELDIIVYNCRKSFFKICISSINQHVTIFSGNYSH